MNIKINLNKIRTIFFYSITASIIFIYFYTPNIKFIPISLDKFLLVFMAIWVLMKRRNTFLSVIGNRYIFKLIFLYFILLIYTIALDLIVQDGLKISYHASLYLIQYIPFSLGLFLFIDYYFQEKAVDIIIKIFIYIIFIQSLIGWFMFISPDIKFFIYNIQSSDPENIYKGLIFRGNGFSSGLAFSVPLIHGMFLGLIFFNNLIQPKLSHFIYFLFCLLIALANARIALIPILIISPLIAFKFLSSMRFLSLLKFAGSAILSIYIFYILSINSVFFSENIDNLQKIVDWIIGGYLNLFGLDQSGNKENITSILMDQINFNTDLVPLFFGEGVNAFSSLSNQSDIGLVNLVAFGGIFYFLAVHFVTYYSLYMGYINSSINSYRFMILFICICYFAASLKGIVFTEQILGRFLILVITFAILDRGIGTIKNKSS